MAALLEIKDLAIHYVTRSSTICAVNGINFSINEGETLGLVGETGAGKTTTAKGIMKILPERTGKYQGGQILFNGQDILKMSEKEMQKIRGSQISMIFQDPMTALNPTLTVYDQIHECLEVHGNRSREEMDKRTNELLEMVGIPANRGGEYPHQFSGGMKQRVVIAMALACNPKLILADEPTTALDVTIQAQVLEMIDELKRKSNSSMLLITHNLGIVANYCDKVGIMYAGEIVEYGTLEDIFDHPAHPYTKGLFNSLPSLDKKVRRLEPIPGMMPDPADLPKGCNFCSRCPQATSRCSGDEKPASYDIGGGHLCKCFLYEKEAERIGSAGKNLNSGEEGNIIDKQEGGAENA